MLISTSRKPSQETRSFCKNLSHVFNSSYVNRGKMSMRELRLKSHDLDHNNIILVYEMKGNPSKITFFSNEGEELLTMLISVKTTKNRLNIKKDDLKMKCDFDKLMILKDILNIEIDEEIEKNYMKIEKIANTENFSENTKKIAIISFFNKFGEDSELKIYVKKIIN